MNNFNSNVSVEATEHGVLIIHTKKWREEFKAFIYKGATGVAVKVMKNGEIAGFYGTEHDVKTSKLPNSVKEVVISALKCPERVLSDINRKCIQNNIYYPY